MSDMAITTKMAAAIHITNSRMSRCPSVRLVRGDMLAFRRRSYLIVTTANSVSLEADRPPSVWTDLDYVEAETNARRRAICGSRCHPDGPELTEEIAAAARGVSASGMTPGAGARRFPCRREPYGRARLPTDLGELVIDGKVLITENGPLLELWRQHLGGRVLDVFIPAAWVQPISREESGWVDVYDLRDD